MCRTVVGLKPATFIDFDAFLLGLADPGFDVFMAFMVFAMVDD